MKPHRLFIGLIVIWTILAFFLESGADSWGSLGIAFILAPAVNLGLTALGILFVFASRRSDFHQECSYPITKIILAALLSTMLMIVFQD